MHLNIFCLFLTLVHAAPAIPSETIDPEIGIPGAFQVPVEWDVKPFPDGPTITLEGTIQEVHEQLLEINPKYDSDFDLPGLAARNTLKARTDFSNSKVYCDANVFGKCTVNRLRQGIDYLRGVGDQPRNGGGPGACGRVSCSYGTAIWWCNDVSRQSKGMMHSRLTIFL